MSVCFLKGGLTDNLSKFEIDLKNMLKKIINRICLYFFLFFQRKVGNPVNYVCFVFVCFFSLKDKVVKQKSCFSLTPHEIDLICQSGLSVSSIMSCLRPCLSQNLSSTNKNTVPSSKMQYSE